MAHEVSERLRHGDVRVRQSASEALPKAPALGSSRIRAGCRRAGLPVRQLQPGVRRTGGRASELWSLPGGRASQARVHRDVRPHCVVRSGCSKVAVRGDPGAIAAAIIRKHDS